MSTGPDDEGRPVEPTFADVMNGFSFDSGRSAKRRRWLRRRASDEAEQAVEPPPVEESRREQYAAEEYPSDQYGTDEYSAQAGGPRHADWAEAEPEAESTSSAVRPYAWTRGRTQSGMDLQIETLVSTTPRGRDQVRLLQFEHRSVAELCDRPQSVAEVAALLSVPLGVAKVLLSDMAGLGLVMVHQSGGSNGDVPDLALMERVLSGLRRL